MVVLGHFYYFIGLLLFLANLGLILKLNKILKTQSWVQSFFKVTKKRPDKRDMPDGDYQDFVSFNSVMVANFLWIFFGLISQSWKMFLLILGVMFILNLLLTMFHKFNLFSKFLNFIKLIIITSSICTLVINHFHLHVDVYKILMEYISSL